MTKHNTAKAMPDEIRLEIRDQLALALDEVESGPLDYMAVRRIAMMYLRPSLQSVHKQMQVMA